MTFDPLALKEILNALTVDQWLAVARAIAQVRNAKHGEITLTVKNGELRYLDIRTSAAVRRKGVSDGG